MFIYLLTLKRAVFELPTRDRRTDGQQLGLMHSTLVQEVAQRRVVRLINDELYNID